MMAAVDFPSRSRVAERVTEDIGTADIGGRHYIVGCCDSHVSAIAGWICSLNL